MHEIGDLFPVFPRENGCSQSVLGTNLLNDDNGLRRFFGFVPSVPKKKGQYPKKGAQHGKPCGCRAMPFGNGYRMGQQGAPPHVGSS